MAMLQTVDARDSAAAAAASAQNQPSIPIGRSLIFSVPIS